jgi:hypothetical protein
MHDYGLRKMMMDDRIEALRRDAFHAPAPAVSTASAARLGELELRLCKAADDPALERLSALAEQPIPFGRLVVALCDGDLVAAVPLAGGNALRDPFVKTAHLLPLLQMRAAQLRQPDPRTPLVPRFLRRHA